MFQLQTLDSSTVNPAATSGHSGVQPRVNPKLTWFNLGSGQLGVNLQSTWVQPGVQLHRPTVLQSRSLLVSRPLLISSRFFTRVCRLTRYTGRIMKSEAPLDRVLHSRPLFSLIGVRVFLRH